MKNQDYIEVQTDYAHGYVYFNGMVAVISFDSSVQFDVKEYLKREAIEIKKLNKG